LLGDYALDKQANEVVEVREIISWVMLSREVKFLVIVTRHRSGTKRSEQSYACGNESSYNTTTMAIKNFETYMKEALPQEQVTCKLQLGCN
jgi:hypothetical protein